jgi:hypothetical protein
MHRCRRGERDLGHHACVRPLKLILCVVVAFGLVGSACDRDIPRRVAATTSSTVRPGEHGLDARWTDVAVPASVCGGEGMAELHDFAAFVSSKQWTDSWVGPSPSVVANQVELTLAGAQYGDLDADGKDEAVVAVWCLNGGGTADGQLAQALVVFTSVDTEPTAIGVLTSSRRDPDVHSPFFDTERTKIGYRKISVAEVFYGPKDATCCPSGRASTEWRFDGHTFVRGPTASSSRRQSRDSA